MINHSFIYQSIIVITINVLSLHLVNAQTTEEDFTPNETTEIPLANTNQSVETTYDYLNIGNNIAFNKELFSLKWGINPNPIYYKQEYFSKNYNVDNFAEKITIEILRGNHNLNDALSVKINELKILQSKNPIIDYEVFNDKKNNQLIIDYITDENKGYYEWNVHRYVKQVKHTPLLLLFKYTYRQVYKEKKDVLDFLTHVKKIRKQIIKKTYLIDIPKIKLKD